jgi:hypothetical protein
VLSDMGRSGESVTRLDIRFPNEMYEKLQQLAVKDGARTHHISQKVEVSPTVIKLVQFAFDTLAGMVPDSGGNISDNLSDTLLPDLSDKVVDVSDISDKRVQGIVDRRLKELGLFPESPASENLPHTSIEAISQSVPDKIESVPDILPDNDVMISDKSALIPDNLPDTENIPSDDSSNSESIAEVVQVTPTNAIEQVSGEVPTSFSFGEFHKWLELTPPDKRDKASGEIAIKLARSQGRGEWVMSRQFKFTKQIDNN